MPAIISSSMEPPGDANLHRSVTLPNLPLPRLPDRDPALRRDICLGLLFAAGRYDRDLIDDADPAAAYGRIPQPGGWAKEVRDAVSSITPGLLARWASEPSACRLALAALAATFPDHGQAITAQIAALAQEHSGTQAGAYARLAHHLASKDTARAVAATAGIAAWSEEIDTDIADDESVRPELRALDVLAQAVTSAATTLTKTP